MSKPKLLIVEDELSIRAGLRDLFIYHGFDVTDVEDGEAGLQKANTENFDLMILDIMLPMMDGFTVCESLRKTNKSLPIIMLTAKTSIEDIINGLSLGADDYMSKPFSVQELLLRVQAVLKRTQPMSSTKIVLGGQLIIDPAELTGQRNGEAVIPFTKREVELLQYLADEDFRTKTREDILHKVWGYKEGPEYDTRTVDIHIAKLRKKVELDPKNPRFITTVRGRGYKLVESEVIE